MKYEVSKTTTVYDYHTVEAKNEEEAIKSITPENRKERSEKIEYYAHSMENMFKECTSENKTLVKSSVF